MNPVYLVVTIIGSIVASIVAIGGLWLSIAKFRKESIKEKEQALITQNKILDKLDGLIQDVSEIKETNEQQQELIEQSRKVANGHFRITLYNAITKALTRGYSTIGEATEITKLYSIYKKNGGNGEIELLYLKFDKLRLEEDSYETKEQIL